MAYANVFTMVNVSVWSNALAVTLAVAVAAVMAIGGPFFQYQINS
jgi:hypothetical protein